MFPSTIFILQRPKTFISSNIFTRQQFLIHLPPPEKIPQEISLSETISKTIIDSEKYSFFFASNRKETVNCVEFSGILLDSWKFYVHLPGLRKRKNSIFYDLRRSRVEIWKWNNTLKSILMCFPVNAVCVCIFFSFQCIFLEVHMILTDWSW